MRTLYTVAPVAQAKLKAYTVSVPLLLLGLVLPASKQGLPFIGTWFGRS